MDQTQQKALNALESFVLLSKSATSPRAAVDLITKATSAPNTFVFAELLQTPNIQALKESERYASHYTLLEIFSWGTWADYNATPGLPQLTESQSQKLRQLTLLTLCTSPSTLTYEHLQAALSLPSARSLEDLIISSIYAGLLTAKLDTLSQRVDVSSVSPLRDLPPNGVPRLVSVLEDWDSRCVSVLEELEQQVMAVRQKALERKRREARDEAAMEKLMEAEEKKERGGKRSAKEVGNGDVGPDGDDSMDVDPRAGKGRFRGSKRGGKALLGAWRGR
ncbi:MAG: hypothetical protein Q9167_005016 [Letrouitia subvulpina]